MTAKFGAVEQTHGIHLHAKFRLDRFILLPFGGEKKQLLPFCRFWTSAFCGVATWQQCEKVEHECTTTNISLFNGIKIVSVIQRLHGEIVRINSDVY